MATRYSLPSLAPNSFIPFTVRRPADKTVPQTSRRPVMRKLQQASSLKFYKRPFASPQSPMNVPLVLLVQPNERRLHITQSTTISFKSTVVPFFTKSIIDHRRLPRQQWTRRLTLLMLKRSPARKSDRKNIFAKLDQIPHRQCRFIFSRCRLLESASPTI